MNRYCCQLPVKSLRRLRGTLFALLALPALLLIAARFSQAQPTPRMNDAAVAQVFEQIEAGQAPAPALGKLWGEVGPAVIAFKRLSDHLTDQIQNGVLNPDKIYMEGQTDVIVQFVGRDAGTARQVLGYFCLHGKSDIERALALVILRELFPKKNSIYYAHHLSLDSYPLIAMQAHDIIAGDYPRGSLNDKLTGKFFAHLADRARVIGR